MTRYTIENVEDFTNLIKSMEIFIQSNMRKFDRKTYCSIITNLSAIDWNVLKCFDDDLFNDD